MDRSRVGIVIPALNESTTIGAVVATAKEFGVPIVVDDGSTDDTADVAKQAGGIVVSHMHNRGYDAALNSGFEKASALGCDVVVTLDADGQHDPNILQRFVEKIESGVDVVVGKRDRKQRLSEHLFAWYTRSRFRISDPLCGMKAYRMTVYRGLGHFDSYSSVGTELMLFAAKNGYCMGEVPVMTRERQGNPRFGPVFRANLKIIRAMALSCRKGG